MSGFGPTIRNAKNWGILFLWEISFNKWGAEILFSYSVEYYQHLYDVPLSANLYGYTTGNEVKGFFMMFIIGIVYRILGFIGLYYYAKKMK